MPTPLDNAVQFLRDFGFFNVVLPFILVFALVFGILEKTKLFGIVKHKGDEYPKSNINSMVAFSIAFFVVAASNIVDAIQVALPQISLVLIIIITMLLLIGSFFGDEQLKFVEKYKWAKGIMMLIILIVVLAIFLNAVGVLMPFLQFVGISMSTGGGGNVVGAAFLLLIMILAFWIIVRKPGDKKGDE
jgi:hypothetical protein